MERVRVGEVLKLQRREVRIDPLAEYRLIGVYSFGKGILHRDPKVGAELGEYKFFSIEPGDLILSNIQAWEGAIALAEERDLGTVGTHRFLSYIPVDERIDTKWARWFLLSERGMDLIRQAAPGSTMRNRTLAIDRFEALEIPLPPIDDQRRVADHLGTLAGAASTTAGLQSSATRLDEALIDSTTSSIFEVDGWPLKELGDIAEVNPAPQRLDPVTEITFVPMAAVDGVTGQVRGADLRPAGEIGPGYKQFSQGDVIFARITPCMQNGKAAIFSGLTANGYGSTEFHVIRAGPEVSAEWVHRIVRTRRFRLSAAEHFTGTAGQQRVPASFLKSALIPVPDRDEQVEALREVDRLSAVGLEIRAARGRAGELLAALVPSSLNEAFAGLS